MRHFADKSLVSLGVLSALTVLTGVSPSQAADVTYNFTANVVQGPFAGQIATGDFTYDDDSLVKIGKETLSAADGLTLNLTFLGQTYTETNDSEFIDFPQLDFIAGVPSFLDYFVVDGFLQTDILNPNIGRLAIVAELTDDGLGGFTTTLDVAPPVPEPNSTISLMLLGSLGVGSTLLKKLRKTH